MTPYIVDLNDAGLRVAHGLDERARSPGYAVLVDGRIEVGTPARARAWLTPRQAHNHFWQMLDTSALGQFGKRVRHAGDLAYLHLAQVLEQAGKPRSAILVVPGSYQRPQLSLLLGIAQAAGLEVMAMVDSACAAAATLPAGRYCHIEALLHQCVVTELEVGESRVRRIRVELVAGAGLAQLERRLVGALVEAFLSRCRFDPLSQAATEQALHDRLPEWLAALGDSAEIPIVLESRGSRHETRIQRAALQAAVAPLLGQMKARAQSGLAVLDHRLAAIPGAIAALDAIHVLSHDAVFAGCLANPALAQRGNAVTLRTELATLAPEARAQAHAVRTSPARSASHILVHNTAFPLAGTPLYLAARGCAQQAPAADSAFSLVLDVDGARLDVVNGATVLLNGDAVLGSARVAPGDHITVPGAATLFLPIKVQAHDAI